MIALKSKKFFKSEILNKNNQKVIFERIKEINVYKEKMLVKEIMYLISFFFIINNISK